ncbi:TonB-dependent receptor [Endozoicomonas sp. G2_1]|uniref:TonB-dependent receptor family protein n=1 Tax=Endozoicomonas sp. G2_1 TaxID=2821091 RepID=UPI001ADA16BA|nr:TonB-dependent receptor [Endozoicomonas sp. G2_1]MBO9490046.1 TonB-dependent receptor [Endozoicomonas sp. G2_1]
MSTFSLKKSSLAVLTALSALTVSLNAVAEDDDNTKSEYVERISIIGHGDKLRTEAGSATLISEVELEKFKFDDINRVLANVPGVNIREEDGFGLRPNIGFRGATPERSRKITIMEDGVLIGPAPYSAPPAYYFPLVNKATAVEVFKGPAAIKYGPNTVAGALNLVTRQVPDASEGQVDLAVGSDSYKKAHAFYGNTIGDFGFLVEGIHLESDGFKELDGGGDTGFEKNDILVKFNYQLEGKRFNQLFELKWSYADENSDESYLGLTDEDFAANPNRRYIASQLDNFESNHRQVQFSHFLEGDNFDVTTRVYRNDYQRDWFKLNNFNSFGGVSADVQEVLANPEDNQRFLSLLRGEVDTVQAFEKILVGNNGRKYYSQGIQSELHLTTKLFGLEHKLNAGIRFHNDQIERNHTEDSFDVRSGNLVSDGAAQVATTTNLEETDAWSVFIQDTLHFGDLATTFGVRGEFIDGHFQNRAPGREGDFLNKKTRIWLPSFSAFYTLSENAGLLFGVHEGFIPTSPQEPPGVEIENSVNYEFGGRYNDGTSKLEAVVFFNDISNLKESCSFSASSSCGGNLDAEFNGGEVDIYGLEFSASHTFELNSNFDLPVSLVYTYTDSEFKTSFDSDFPQWGRIEAGDELPYLPENQLTLNIGLAADNWEVSLIARYIDELLEASGDSFTGADGRFVSIPLSGVTTEAYTVVDLSASYSLQDYGQVYLKVDNIFDEQEIVSRRPYGARPSKPQQVFVGYKYSF